MKDLVYNSQYQNLHMDRANKEAMKTIKVTFNSDIAYSTTPRLLARYKHGYDYIPQVWGLWDINYFPNAGSTYARTARGYGYINHNTSAAMTASFYYTVDSEYVNLYFIFDGFLTKPTTVGMTAVFTGYVFANDRQNQDYT